METEAILHKTDMLERAIYAEICRHDGIKARQIEKAVPADRHRINHYLYCAPFLKELCLRLLSVLRVLRMQQMTLLRLISLNC